MQPDLLYSWKHVCQVPKIFRLLYEASLNVTYELMRINIWSCNKMCMSSKFIICFHNIVVTGSKKYTCENNTSIWIKLIRRMRSVSWQTPFYPLTQNYLNTFCAWTSFFKLFYLSPRYSFLWAWRTMQHLFTWVEIEAALSYKWFFKKHFILCVSEFVTKI